MYDDNYYRQVKLVVICSDVFMMNMDMLIENIESVTNDPLFAKLASTYQLTLVDLIPKNVNDPDHLMTLVFDTTNFELIFEVMQDLLELTDLEAEMYNDILCLLNDKNYSKPLTLLMINRKLSITNVKINNSLEVASKEIIYKG